MKSVFISYRRDDSMSVAHRLAARLRELLGPSQVFLDVDSIPIGTDFREHIRGAVGKCDTVLVLIGPAWSGNTTERLMDPSDYVRLEVEEALARNIPTVPVLIGQTPVPTEALLPEALRPLLFRQAERIDPGVDFDGHVDRLFGKLTGALPNKRFARRMRVTAMVAAGAALSAAVAAAAIFWPTRTALPPVVEPKGGVNVTTTGNSGETNVNAAGRDLVVNRPDPEVAKQLKANAAADEKARSEQRELDRSKAEKAEADRIAAAKEVARKEAEVRTRIAKEKAAEADRVYRAAIKEDVEAIHAVAGLNRNDPDQLAKFSAVFEGMRRYRGVGRSHASLAIIRIEEKKFAEARAALQKSVEFYRLAKDDAMLRWLDEEVKPMIPRD